MNEQVWNTGKVKIGVYAAPKKVQQDADADLLQRALLAADEQRINWDNVIMVACGLGFVFIFVAGLAGWLPGGRA